MSRPLTIHVEFATKNWSAYSPDVDGVAAAAHTIEECVALYLDALDFHLEGCEVSERPNPLPDLSRVIVYATVEPSQLKAFRKYHKLTQRDVAEKLGVIQARISVIEQSPGNVTYNILSRYFAAVLEAARITDPVVLAMAA